MIQKNDSRQSRAGAVSVTQPKPHVPTKKELLLQEEELIKIENAEEKKRLRFIVAGIAIFALLSFGLFLKHGKNKMTRNQVVSDTHSSAVDENSVQPVPSTSDKSQIERTTDGMKKRTDLLNELEK